MALFADDVERLKEIASTIDDPHFNDALLSRYATYLEGLADRIAESLAEPEVFPWPGPGDEPEEHP